MNSFENSGNTNYNSKFPPMNDSTPQFSGYPPKSQKKNRQSYTSNDSIFAWLAFLVCFLFVRAFPIVENTLGGVLAILMLFGFATTYFCFSKVKLSAPTIAFGITVCALSLGLITGANTVIHLFLYFFIILAYLYYIYCASGLSGKNPISDDTLAFALRAIFVLPFSRPHAIFRSIFVRDKKSRKFSLTLVWILLGLIAAVVPTAVVIFLLSYDGSFIALMDKIFSLSVKETFALIFDVIFAFHFAIFLFSAMFSSQLRYRLRNEDPRSIRKAKTQVLPKVLLCTALTPVLIIYVIFFISQWNYYIAPFTNVKPGELPLSEYARSGFFELCWVSGINAVMLLLFRLFARRKDGEKGVIRAIYSSLISVFTLILIATAISKMVLYIKSYGLTQKRVYATWFMILLAAIFVVVLLSQFIKKVRLVPVIVVLCIAFGGIIALPDVDGMIAHYNVEAYLDGDLENVDVDTLGTYGASAVPALVELRDTLRDRPQRDYVEENILNETDITLAKIKEELNEKPNNLFTFNIPTARARALLK